MTTTCRCFILSSFLAALSLSTACCWAEEPVDLWKLARSQQDVHLFDDGSWVVENFNDSPASVELDGETMEISSRGWRYRWND